MFELKYSEIISQNQALKAQAKGADYNIAVLSNITTSFINDILEFTLRSKGVNANVKTGDYDNILQESANLANNHAVLIFWELCNIIDGFQYKALVMSPAEIDQIREKIYAEIDITLENLKATPLIIFNKFSSVVFTNNNLQKNVLDVLADEMNAYLEGKNMPNLILVDLNKAFVNVGLEKSVDFRFFYTSKSLYTVDFYKQYVTYIVPAIYATQGKAKKALILDCDNTLWAGILGEDGFDNIKMSSHAKNGVYFEEIAYFAQYLAGKGVILGLCSKNNLEDVNEVLDKHPDTVLKEKDIIVKRIDWNDKAGNLELISKDLNIGKDALVFVDDSDFEINLIRDKQPAVTCLQVPSKIYNYPKMMRELEPLFYVNSLTEEDKKRNQLYKTEIIRNKEKESVSNIEDYLRNLDLKIIIYKDDASLNVRLAQMTQKTNQFNLTTKRYSEIEMEGFTAQANKMVLAFQVLDKFGDYGITGLSIVDIDGTKANIDSLLMSCRVLGRNIEVAFFDQIIHNLSALNIKTVTAKFILTQKNKQVENFYNDRGFSLLEETHGNKLYELKIEDYKTINLNYITIQNGR